MRSAFILLTLGALLASCSNWRTGSYSLHGIVIDKKTKTAQVNTSFVATYNQEEYTFTTNEKGEYELEIYWKEYPFGESTYHVLKRDTRAPLSKVKVRKDRSINTSKIIIASSGEPRVMDNRWKGVVPPLFLNGKRIKKNIKVRSLVMDQALKQ